MPRSKNQLAQREYDCDFDELSAGEKSHITRVFNSQGTGGSTGTSSDANHVKVSFGRPNVNGTKGCVVTKGTSIGDALEQSEIRVNTDKEALQTLDGDSVSLSDEVVEGATYVIVPGIDSSW